MKFIKLITAFFLLITSYSNLIVSNQNKLDSLIIQFKLSENDSLKYATLEEIEHIVEELGQDTTMAIWNSLTAYCEENNNYKCAGFCHYNMAKILKNEGDYFSSYQSYQKSLEYYELCKHQPGLALAHNGLGILFKKINKFTESFDHYSKSAELFKALKDTIREGWIYLNLGGMLEKQNALELAKVYLEKSKNILEEQNDSNLMHCYINLGIVYKKENKPDTAYHYFYNSYKLSIIYGDEVDKFQARYHLGEHLFEQNKITEAESILIDALKIFSNKNIENSIPIDDRAEFTKLLNKLYAEKGDFKNAYVFLLQSSNYETESKREQSIIDLNRLEIENLENESKIQRKRREFIIGITLVVLIFSILLIFLLYRNYKHKKNANRLLTEMDELKTRLYSNITHELRTPLTLIIGPLEQMLSSQTNKKPKRRQVKMMRKNANTLLNLINQMLDLSKIEAKSINLELVEEDINKFLRTRFAAFASLAEQKSISYNFSLLKEKNIQIFDAGKLEKIINNLISNAIKFTPQHGEISCYANFPKQNILELSIRDSGKGVPKNELDKIFDRFHQIENSETSKIVGTGIGLSLTKELVELMHGKIDVNSELNKGSIFTIQLTLGTSHLHKDEFHLIKSANTNWRETHKNEEPEEIIELCDHNQISKIDKENIYQVLIADDHADIREFIAENLKDCFSIEQAENGKIALNKAIENIPDLIITDVVMPEMDGIEFCKNLKLDERTSHIPVIILTGKSSAEDRIKGIEIGADAYLNKPFNIKELKLRVQKLIEQRQKLRERFAHNLNLEPKDIAITPADEIFISRAMEIIEKNISNSEFEVKQFQEEMFVSRMQLFRKIKALSNQTPSEFIRTIRLKRAANLLKQNFGNIAQVTFEVGFNNPSYFAKCFKELYGELPSEYVKKHS